MTTIAVFLFTRRLQRYAILRIKPVRTEFHFSALCHGLRHGDYVLWVAELWFVVVAKKNIFRGRPAPALPVQYSLSDFWTFHFLRLGLYSVDKNLDSCLYFL